MVFTTELHGAPHSSAGAGPPPLCSGGGFGCFPSYFPSFPDILAHPPPQGLVCDNGFPVFMLRGRTEKKPQVEVVPEICICNNGASPVQKKKHRLSQSYRVNSKKPQSRTADGLNCFSKDVATLSKTHDSRVLTHARQMRTTPRHTSTFIFTRPAAGVTTATPARYRGLVG